MNMNMKFTAYYYLILALISIDAFGPQSFHQENVFQRHYDKLESRIITPTQLHSSNEVPKPLRGTRQKPPKLVTSTNSNGDQVHSSNKILKPLLGTRKKPPKLMTSTILNGDPVSHTKEQRNNTPSPEVNPKSSLSNKGSSSFSTDVKNGVQALPLNSIINSLTSPSGCNMIIDDFLGEHSYAMRMESLSMFGLDRKALDKASFLPSGQYQFTFEEGNDNDDINCPLVTEFVNIITNHLTTSINQHEKAQFQLNNVPISTMRTFNRRESETRKYLNNLGKTSDRPFQFVKDYSGYNQYAQGVTAMYFLTPTGWNKECGGGVTIKSPNGNKLVVEAKNDRLIFLNSDRCLHRMDEWLGDAYRNDNGSIIVIHMLEKKRNPAALKDDRNVHKDQQISEIGKVPAASSFEEIVKAGSNNIKPTATTSVYIKDEAKMTLSPLDGNIRPGEKHESLIEDSPNNKNFSYMEKSSKGLIIDKVNDAITSNTTESTILSKEEEIVAKLESQANFSSQAGIKKNYIDELQQIEIATNHRMNVVDSDEEISIFDKHDKEHENDIEYFLDSNKVSQNIDENRAVKTEAVVDITDDQFQDVAKTEAQLANNIAESSQQNVLAAARHAVLEAQIQLNKARQAEEAGKC